MSIQLFWNVMLFCCAFIFPCKSNCCKLLFFFFSFYLFFRSEKTLFIAQLLFLDTVCDPGISRTNYLKPHVKQCCYLDSSWYYNIVTYTNRNLAIYGCLYICIVYIHTRISMIHICKVTPRTEGKKQNFCFPPLKPKGLLWSSIMALCWIYIKKSASLVSLLFQYLNGADDVTKTLVSAFLGPFWSRGLLIFPVVKKTKTSVYNIPVRLVLQNFSMFWEDFIVSLFQKK